MSEQVQLTQEQIEELNRLPAIYVNSNYFMQSGSVVKIAMCEGNTARACICMGIQEFSAFLDAAQKHKEFIDRIIAAHQESLKQ